MYITALCAENRQEKTENFKEKSICSKLIVDFNKGKIISNKENEICYSILNI
tara:strand:+ start:770 stop:925 length:156 start_codon:yes stop_codon:yes gene_type:complete